MTGDRKSMITDLEGRILRYGLRVNRDRTSLQRESGETLLVADSLMVGISSGGRGEVTEEK